MNESLVSRVSLGLCALAVAPLLLASCTSRVKDATISMATEEIVASTPPFKTREPEQYRAVRTTTLKDASGNSVITKALIARSGDRRREEIQTDNKPAVIYLNSEQGRFILLSGANVFAEVETSGGPAAKSQGDFENSPERLLHPEPVATTYQKLGSESIAGRLTTKYRIVVNTSSGTNVTHSESFIWVDEKLGMPVRSETKTENGTSSLMEMSDIVLDVDPLSFRIPDSYKKVTASDLRIRLSKSH